MILINSMPARDVCNYCAVRYLESAGQGMKWDYVYIALAAILLQLGVAGKSLHSLNAKSTKSIHYSWCSQVRAGLWGGAENSISLQVANRPAREKTGA